MTGPRITSEFVLALARALDEHEIVHAFIGGIAMNAWGIPRATYDLDAVVVLSPEQQPRVLSRLRELGYHVDEIYERGWRDTMAGMPIIHVFMVRDESLIRVDLVIAATPHLSALVERRIRVEIEAGSVWVCRPADLILLKLLAWRPKDRIDLDNVLMVQGVPEPDYLRARARDLNVESRLDQAITNIGGSLR